MHKGQEQFLQFIVERAQDDQKEAAKSILLDTFTRQEEGSFLKEDLNKFNNTILSLLKPECKEEVSAILTQFGSQHTN